MLPFRGGLLGGSAGAQFVGGGVKAGSTSSLSASDLSTAGAQAGDLLLVFIPYNGFGSGAGVTTVTSHYWSASYGYSTNVLAVLITSAHLASGMSGTFTAGGNYQWSWAIYRGATSAVSVEHQEVSGTSIAFASSYSPVGKGEVVFLTDRDGAAASGPSWPSASGFTSRVNGGDGFFTNSILDRLNGNDGSPKTFNPFGSIYYQLGIRLELR